MININKISLFCMLSLFFFFACKQSFGMVKDSTTIIAGKAKILGRITSFNHKNMDSVFVNITVSHPISGENVQYKALVDSLGRFSIDADIETAISTVGIYTSLNPYKSLLVRLVNNRVTYIDISYNSDDDIEKIEVRPIMNQNDMIRGLQMIGNMIEYRSGRIPESLYNKSTNYFLNYAKTILLERLEILKNDTLISNELKEMLSKDFRLFLYNAHVFNYKEEMMLNYSNTKGDKSKLPDLQKIDRSYYRFLKDFNLNNPEYLNCFTYLDFQKTILQNEILNIPVIGESDIPTWLLKVKGILADLVGFNNGLYYDILVANAYGTQLNDEVKPLTEKQKENIKKYWKDGEIPKILFRKNNEVIKLSRLKSPTVVNDISLVPNDNVMETIISKYPNKVVFIDLWATWCAPCIEAMQQFRNTKAEFRDKDVVFVYLTNPSSPQKLWEEKIKGIGNEHYYLKGSQWDYIMNHFKFEGIPSYLLYNKKGVLVNKFTTFPGTSEVNNMIGSLL